MKPEIILPNAHYFGGKGAAGVVHRIINETPRHEVFVSGFLGHCAVMRHKRPAARNIGVEINPDVIQTWSRAEYAPGWAASQKVEVLPASFLDLEAPEFLKPSTFVYLDPPYMHETRTSRHRYPFELTDNEHRALLEKIKGLPCMVALSCYDSGMYRAALEGWRKIKFPAQSRGGLRTETLYMNYPAPAPDALHDARYIGENFRQREKSKRRIETILRKVNRLSAEERAVLVERVTGQPSPLVPNSKPQLFEP
ncbi:MAG: DNA adenine methylase [Chitinophagales bacterium]|nr:DNA adenine methylase [Chitinophagales bacterium]